MRKYYFLNTFLPKLSLDETPEITFSELKALFFINLSAKDSEKVRVIQFYIDLYNLRALWLKQPMDKRGFYSKEELEVAVALGIMLPDYVLDFLQLYDTREKRVEAFPFLIAAYFNENIPKASSFLKEYLTFERELRLVLCALRTKEVQGDIVHELRFEDPLDEKVAYILVQKDAKEFDPPDGFEQVKMLFEKNKKSPLELFKGILQFRFEKIEALIGTEAFTIDALLAYTLQLSIVEMWQDAKKVKGLEIVDKMILTVKETA